MSSFRQERALEVKVFWQQASTQNQNLCSTRSSYCFRSSVRRMLANRIKNLKLVVHTWWPSHWGGVWRRWRRCSCRKPDRRPLATSQGQGPWTRLGGPAIKMVVLCGEVTQKNPFHILLRIEFAFYTHDGRFMYWVERFIWKDSMFP